MNARVLVSASDLAARLGAPGLVVVDCRAALADPEAGERAWREAHVPGAGHVHLDRDLSDHRKPAAWGRHPLPEAGDFQAVLERLGIGPASTVVAYDAGDGAMAAARFWWLLRLWGHRDVAVLDGGLAAWQSIGGALDAAIPSTVASRYPGDFDRAQVVGIEDVSARLAEPAGWLLDARAPERFRGEVEPLDPVAGHIPGARNRPFTDNLADGRFRAPDELRRAFLGLLAGRAPADVVLSCGSGVTACHNLLAMEHAGLPGARVFAASWSGWVSDPGRPVARGDQS